MKQMESTFNHWAGYPYVFLNDEPFSDEFKKYTQQLTNAPCHYGQIPQEHWVQPDWIDEEKATKARQEMIEKKVIYGHSVPYRNSESFVSSSEAVSEGGGTRRGVCCWKDHRPLPKNPS
jgi:alpha 1,2-mannosyltransferase